jgi:NAD(P)-dependent dehydrogenase (short-subunit alcohol dehydrogenase family)
LSGERAGSFEPDEVALVTGAASGIGAAVAVRFLAAGLSVIGVDKSPPPPDLAGDSVDWVQGDVASKETWEAVSELIAGGSRRAPGVAVMNAAIMRVGDVLSLDIEDWNAVLQTNVVGSAMGIKTVLPAMISRGKGSIVTVASVDGLFAEQKAACYCASKGALIQLTKATAVDFAHAGVRANCVCPGTTDTPFFRSHVALAPDPQALLAERAARNPIGRILEPDEVAAAVEFLAGSMSKGMTGAVVVVDGGLTASFDHRGSG